MDSVALPKVKGVDQGSYWHPLFIKGMESICLRMTRCKIKGVLANIEVGDPNFYQEAYEGDTTRDAVVNAAPEVQKTACPDVLIFATEVGSAPESIYTLFDKVLFEDLATIDFFWPRQCWSSCAPAAAAAATSSAVAATAAAAAAAKTRTCTRSIVHRDKNDTSDPYQQNEQKMLLSEFEPRPLPPSPNRRGSVFGEGDECIFAGKGFLSCQKRLL